MTFSMGACSDNNDPNPDGGGKDPVNLDYSSENASAWGNYMYNVAMLLNDDATTLYNSWVTDYVDEQGSHGPYATIFKDQTAGAYQSPLSCIEEMIESGMWNIANEVGDAKIKDPYTKYTSGDKEGVFMPSNHGIAGIRATTIRTISSPSVTHTTAASTTTTCPK